MDRLGTLVAAVALAVALAVGGVGHVSAAAPADQQGQLQTLVTEWWQAAASSTRLPECDVADPSGQIWFLAGTTGNPVNTPEVRTCTVPHTASIFFPIFAVEWSTLEGPCPLRPGRTAPGKNPRDPQALTSCADAFADHVQPSTDLRLTIDGQTISNLAQDRVPTGVFPITFAPNNVFGVPAGSGQAAADGYWVLLPPLSPGQHTIQFSASIKFPELGFTFETSVNYTLNVT